MFGNVMLALLLMKTFAHVGLALATALAAMVNVGILFVVLVRRLGDFRWSMFGRSLWRILLALIPLILACFWIADLAVWGRPDQWMAKLVMLFVGIGLSVTGYIGTHALLRSEELEQIWSMIRTKIRPAEKGRR